MPSLKDVKMKIVGVRKTKQITKAMNMVASAKLRGAQSRIERFRPYAEKFQAVLGDLAAKSDGSAHALLERRAECHVSVIILATSDRGLCGGFNAMLIAKALDAARTRAAEGKTVKFICVGKKGRDAIRKTGVPGVKVIDKKNVQIIVGTQVQAVADALSALYGKPVIGGGSPKA